MLVRMIKDYLGGVTEAAQAAEQALAGRLDELAASIEPIQGWLHPEAGKVLYRLARFHAPGSTIVELGSWKGRSTAWLASAVRDRGEGKVHAVDTWEGTQNEDIHGQMLAGYAAGQLQAEFLANLESRGLREYVEPARASTLAAARAWDSSLRIGLLFIDADHAYEAVRQDFEFWSPHVGPGGFIVFDDVPSFMGPSRLITELPRWYSVWGISPNNWIVVKNG